MSVTAPSFSRLEPSPRAESKGAPPQGAAFDAVRAGGASSLVESPNSYDLICTATRASRRPSAIMRCRKWSKKSRELSKKRIRSECSPKGRQVQSHFTTARNQRFLKRRSPQPRSGETRISAECLCARIGTCAPLCQEGRPVGHRFLKSRFPQPCSGETRTPREVCAPA